MNNDLSLRKNQKTLVPMIALTLEAILEAEIG